MATIDGKQQEDPTILLTTLCLFAFKQGAPVARQASGLSGSTSVCGMSKYNGARAPFLSFFSFFFFFFFFVVVVVAVGWLVGL